MENKRPLPPTELSELENPYFDIQAEVGITKHGGGLKTTRELIELCQVDKGKYILDIGCGVGATACYLARRHGCRAVCIDISERMIDRAKERAKREGVEGKVKFVIADAQQLPFKDAPDSLRRPGAISFEICTLATAFSRF